MQANHLNFEYSPSLQRTTAAVLTHSVGMLDLPTYRILQAPFQLSLSNRELKNNIKEETQAKHLPRNMM